MFSIYSVIWPGLSRHAEGTAFIVVGILSGPAALGWVTAHDQIDLLAQLGVTLLLFAIGWGVTAAVVGDQAGFGKEVGAFLAGFLLASSTYRETISAGKVRHDRHGHAWDGNGCEPGARLGGDQNYPFGEDSRDAGEMTAKSRGTWSIGGAI